MMPARDEVIGSTVFVSGDGTTCKPLSPWHGAQRSDCIKPKRMEGRADDPAGMRKIAYHTLSPLKSAPQHSRPARARKAQMTLSSQPNNENMSFPHRLKVLSKNAFWGEVTNPRVQHPVLGASTGHETLMFATHSMIWGFLH